VPFTCAPDEIFDAIHASKSEVKQKLAALNKDRKDLGLEELKAKGGEGTCWKCAAGTKRTTNAVYGEAACSPVDIVWVPAKYQQPGLFGLVGAEPIAAALVRDGALINLIADGMAPALKLTPAESRRKAWQEIARAPESSPVLKIAVFSLVHQAFGSQEARSKATPEMQALLRSPEMQRLIKSTQDEMQAFAIFLAQDALDAYDAWYAGVEFQKARVRLRSSLEDQFDFGKVPPDFEDITGQKIMDSILPVGASSTALTIALMQEPVFKKVFPNALKKYHEFSEASKTGLNAGENAAKAGAQTAGKVGAKSVQWGDQVVQASGKMGGRLIREATEKITTELIEQTVKESFTALAISMSAGPQIIVTISMELISISIEQFSDIVEARPKLLAGLNQAKNVPPDFARLIKTTDGEEELQWRWSLLMAGTTPPFQRPLFALSNSDIEARVALAAEKGMPVTQPTAITATPTTIATTTTAIKSTPVSGATNEGVGRHPTAQPIAAVPAATPSTGQNTTATSAGPTATAGASASPAQGTAASAPVVAVPHPEALDIAVGPSGTVWFTGKTEPANAADKLIYYVTAQGPKALPSGAAVRIAVDATNNPWVVNSLGHLFRWDGTKWLYIRANVKDIALNAGNRIWALDASGIAHRWDGGNTWTPAVQKEGHLGAAIAVDPGGNPWLVSRVGDIWRMQNGAWQKLQGWASDVAIAADGTAFVVGTAGQIWKMAPGAAAWEMVPGAVGDHVGAGPAGTVHYTK
jgi:hypothetical protein